MPMCPKCSRQCSMIETWKAGMSDSCSVSESGEITACFVCPDCTTPLIWEKTKLGFFFHVSSIAALLGFVWFVIVSSDFLGYFFLGNEPPGFSVLNSFLFALSLIVVVLIFQRWALLRIVLVEGFVIKS